MSFVRLIEASEFPVSVLQDAKDITKAIDSISEVIFFIFDKYSIPYACKLLIKHTVYRFLPNTSSKSNPIEP